jgi:hypothetical protein
VAQPEAEGRSRTRMAGAAQFTGRDQKGEIIRESAGTSNRREDWLIGFWRNAQNRHSGVLAIISRT